MAEEVKYNNTLVSGRADETLTYTKYVKDESSGKSTKELLDEKVNKTDQLGTTQIADKAVTNEKLAEHSVDNSKLSPDSVSYDKIQNDAVITEKIQDNAVTTEKVKEKAITNTKLGDQSVNGRVVREASLETKHFANESVTTEKVARKSITKDKLADNAVDASQVVDESIGNSKLSPDSVTTEKIKDSSVTNEKVADDTLGIEKLDPELRKTIQAATGLPEDLSQMIQDVDKSVKQLKEKDTDLQSQIDDKQRQITANDDDISLLQTRSTQMEKAIKDISASGGASQASAVTYENTESGLDSVTAQGAIDELASKKFNKENIVQEFGDSEDKVVSQFALPFREIESPEFIKAIVDAEDHFLFGIQLDGSIEWGKGIPAPIRAKLQEIVNQCQQDKTDIFEAINAAKKELSASITALQGSKVDKEEGKSLIEDEVKECFRVIENEEFIKAIVDSDDKVLFGIYRNSGKPYFPLNEMYHVEQNEEFFAVWLDAANHVLFGIRRDGEIIGEIHAVNALKQVISQLQSDIASLQEKVGTIDTNLKELLDVFSLQDNEEYLAVEQDAEGKVLSATNSDGSHYLYKVKSETIPTEFEHIEDPEGRTEITTDAENKVLGFRDKEGIRHEEKIATKKVFFEGNGISELINDLKDAGFSFKEQIDLSDVTDIVVPIPNCVAKVNFIANQLPTSKTSNLNGFMEYWDKDGNYFKKAIKNFSLQGSTSLLAPKKNYAIDLVDSTIKFGNLVTQDSFHFKANYYDIVRGKSNLAYDLWLDIINYNRPSYKTKPWLILSSGNYTPYDGESNFDNDFSNEARCTPCGFPVEIYFNGDYLGLFTMNIKKHRDNYNMNKKSASNIMIDPDSIGDLFRGISIPWGGFELRNPKGLKYQEEHEGTLDYDADLVQAEIMGEDSSFYDASDADCKRTAEVKNHLVSFKNAMAEIVSEPTKEKIEKVFDIDWMIDFFLWSNLVLDGDGTYRNTQWLMYDGIKMFPSPYDCDQIFGCQWLGNYINKKKRNPQSVVIGYNSHEVPFKNIFTLYSDKFKARYAELKDAGIYTTEYVIEKLSTYMKKIGKVAYRREFDKWNETPCYRKPNVNDGWQFMGDYYEGDSEPMPFSESSQYNVGDYVKHGDFFYKATASVQGVIPKGNMYTSGPTEGGYFDSLTRIEKWLEMRLIFLDSFFNNLK